jgi:hypothetical protein
LIEDGLAGRLPGVMTTGTTEGPLGPVIVDEDVIGTNIARVLEVIKTEEPALTEIGPRGVLELVDVTLTGRSVGGKGGDVALAVTRGVVILATREVVVILATRVAVVMLATKVVPIWTTPGGGGAGRVELAH